MAKGAPFAGYEDFADCTSQNGDKRDPEAYCGEIKHRTEDKGKEAAMQAQGASSLPQLQQVTDPNNAPAPQDDQLPEGVMFPIGEAFAQQWVTGPQGAQPRGQKEGAKSALPADAARMFGRMDAMDGRQPQHKDEFAYSKVQHGRYLGGYNEVAGWVAAMSGRPPMSREDYASATGRPDMHAHYLASYAEGRKAHHGTGRQEATAGLRAQGDAWSQPHATTDDLAAPYNSPATTPQPESQNASPQAQDYAAGLAAGRADRASGQRPAFADNSSGVSPYVKGYAEGYGAPVTPQGQRDVPRSMGGDSGQAANAQQAAQYFQVARASRAFAPDSLMRDPEFGKGYRFASRWRQGARLAAQGSARFEAGLYAGMTDQAPSVQRAWLSAHAAASGSHPGLGRRIELHRSFTRKHARDRGLRAHGAYIRQAESLPDQDDQGRSTVARLQRAQQAGLLEAHERLSEISPARARQLLRQLDRYEAMGGRTAGTSTDLITDGPGVSPDPMGATPLNGPGTPPPMGGRDDANAPGGAPPYQGAPPLPGGPVVPDDVMGKPQQPAQPSGPFTQTFSGNHPGNATLAPVAPNAAAEPGYSNRDAYQGSPRGGDRTATLKMAAFRDRVQAGLAMMGAN